MGFGSYVRDHVFVTDAKKMGIKVSLRDDTVSVGRSGGLMTGAQASVTAGASRGTLTRSALQTGWQKKGAVFITIVTGDGVEMSVSVKDEKKARDWCARFNTRSGAHLKE
jgi:hypothetical protein